MPSSQAGKRRSLAAAFAAARITVRDGRMPRSFRVGQVVPLRRRAILTAVNPGGRRQAAGRNALALMALEAAAARRGWRTAPAASWGRGWPAEAMVALAGASLPQALALARRFAQAGIFWIDGTGRVVLVMADGAAVVRGRPATERNA